MSRIENRRYHESRAEDELRRATESSDPAVAKAHRELAALHRRRMTEIAYFGEAQGQHRPLIGTRRLQQDLS